MQGFETQFIGLMVIAVFVAVTAQRFRIPYTVAMVITGLAVGFLPLAGFNLIELSPHLILVTFLPGLIFEAAYHLDLSELKDNFRTIVFFAVPGMLLSMAVVGFILYWVLGLPLIEALLFGSLISATDPIAVIALFKELGVNKRLSVIVEGESLFNDGTAIVLYSILVGVAAGEHGFSLTQSIIEFFVTVGGGAALGLVAGLITAELMRRTEDPKLDIALTAILAYGTYLLAEDVLHGAVSPVIAVVVAGVYVGNFGSKGGYSATSQVTIISFWEFVVFLINSAIFLLIGLEVNPVDLISNWQPVIIAIGVILLARAVVVYSLGFIIDRFVRGLSLRWAHVLFWGGLRGAVSMALALSLPLTVASRGLMELMAFGYVLFSLIVQVLSIRPLLRWLGMTHVDESVREFERQTARMALAHATVHAVDELHDENIVSGPFYSRLRKLFYDQMERHSNVVTELVVSDPSLAKTNAALVEREIVAVQKQTLSRLLRRGVISEEIHDELSHQIDEREATRRKGGTGLLAEGGASLLEPLSVSELIDAKLAAREGGTESVEDQ